MRVYSLTAVLLLTNYTYGMESEDLFDSQSTALPQDKIKIDIGSTKQSRLNAMESQELNDRGESEKNNITQTVSGMNKNADEQLAMADKLIGMYERLDVLKQKTALQQQTCNQAGLMDVKWVFQYQDRCSVEHNVIYDVYLGRNSASFSDRIREQIKQAGFTVNSEKKREIGLQRGLDRKDLNDRGFEHLRITSNDLLLYINVLCSKSFIEKFPIDVARK